jgi:MFS family permease
MLGSRMTTIAYPLLALVLTGSPMAAGWISFAAIAPSILVYLPAGVLVDRWDPRRAMLLSEFGRGVAIMTIVAALALRRMSVVELVLVAAIEQTLGVFSVLAERRIVRSLVEPGQAASALARSEARAHLVILIGRPLGALLFGVGRILPFAADAFSFAVSVCLLTRIRNRRGPNNAERTESWRLGDGIGETFRWLRLHPFAGIALPLTAGTTLISQALIMVFLAEAHTRHLSPVTIGMVLAASGAGGALGSAMASRLFSRVAYFLLPIQLWVWIVTLSALAMSGGRSSVAVAAAMAVLGCTGALGNIAIDTFVVRNAAETILARVMSVDRLTSFGALALGPPLGGILFELYGIQYATLTLVILTVCLLIAVAVASLRAFRATPLERAIRPSSARQRLAQFLPGVRSSGLPAQIREDADGPGRYGDAVAGGRRLRRGRRIVGVYCDLPGGLRPGGWDDEVEWLPPGVDQDQEVVVEQERAISRPVRVIGSVEVERYGQGARVRPVGLRHLRTGGGEPAKFGGLGSGQETAAAEHGVGPAEGDNPFGESQQLGVGRGPVKPGNLVVLAIRVVVSLLGPAYLIAAEEQRDAKRQQ